MRSLLDEIKKRKLSVLYCARVTNTAPRTMQDRFDKGFGGREDLERQIKEIIRTHDLLMDSCKIMRNASN